MRLFGHSLRQLLLWLVLLGLVACGQTQPAAILPSAVPSQPPAAASVPAGDPTAASTTPQTARDPFAFLADLPQSRNAEGYWTLGADTASVTLVNYSDFL